MALKNTDLPSLIRNFEDYRVSRTAMGHFIIEQNIPDIYGAPAWKFWDEVTPHSPHPLWVNCLLNSLWAEKDIVADQAHGMGLLATPEMDVFTNPPVDDDKTPF